jgi:hypothetical protein
MPDASAVLLTAMDIVGDVLSEPLVIALLAAAAGVLLGDRLATRRGRQDHQRDLDRLVLEHQRRVAQDALKAARAIRVQVAGGQVPSWGALHNDWSDGVLTATGIVREDAFQLRASAAAYAIFLGTIAPNEHVSYAVLRGALDVEEWIEAWLVRKEPPAAHLPPMSEMRKMVLVRNRITLDALNAHLASVA